METLSDIVAENILPFIETRSVHIRLSIQDRQLKRKRFNHIRDVYIPIDMIPSLLKELDNGLLYLRIDKNTGYPILGGSGQHALLETELTQLMNFPFTSYKSIKNTFDSVSNKTFGKQSFLIYIVFSR
jgi:hypothetical protein